MARPRPSVPRPGGQGAERPLVCTGPRGIAGLPQRRGFDHRFNCSHPATAPKDRSGRPEQGRGPVGKRSSSWKGNPRTDGYGPTVGEQRFGRGTCA